MKTMKEETLSQKLDFLLEKVDEIKADVKQINDLKVEQARMAADIGWIQVLFPIAFSVIAILLGVLIKLAM